MTNTICTTDDTLIAETAEALAATTDDTLIAETAEALAATTAAAAEALADPITALRAYPSLRAIFYAHVSEVCIEYCLLNCATSTTAAAAEALADLDRADRKVRGALAILQAIEGGGDSAAILDE